MGSDIKYTLQHLLRRIQLLIPGHSPPHSSSELRNVYNTICRLILVEQAYQSLWDEPILSQLNWLFQVMPPGSGGFGLQIDELRDRAQLVKRVNDLFFRILDRDSSIEKVLQALAAASLVQPFHPDDLKSYQHLQKTREADLTPPEKVAAFLDLIRQDLGVDLLNHGTVKGCLEALKGRSEPGVVNALLVSTDSSAGFVVPLIIAFHQGSGQVHDAMRGQPDFRAAVERARLAMLKQGFVGTSSDVVYTLELTEPQYSGPSISLAAAVAMYGAARKVGIDPYTAFTGDISMDHQGEWRVQGVGGLRQKLEAARISGCRRVFIPRDNLKELDSTSQEGLDVIAVDDLTGVLLRLQVPLQPLPGESVQIRKINSLQGFCKDRGWQLLPPRPIQDGVQFRVAPLQLPELVITIYSSGAHTPRGHNERDYNDLLNVLAAAGEPPIPVRKVEQRLNVRNSSVREKIREALIGLGPVEQRHEPSCEYAFRFERGQERLLVKQHTNGTLQVQGTAGELYKAILERIIPIYNVHYPNAELSAEGLLRRKDTASAGSRPTPLANVQDVPLPHIGTDESGKGDYFGPMVVAGVWVDAVTKGKLEALAVRDSKLLSDRHCRELAARIREICRGKYEEVEISPERYNELYDQFRKEGKNLNFLLAWGHARAIESLLERAPCNYAIADQFGNERYILAKLMEKGKRVNLIQLPKGERYVAVAAASILARDKFLGRLDKLSQEYGVKVPKGSSDAVVTTAIRIVKAAGADELRKVAKLHHKTTYKIVDKE